LSLSSAAFAQDNKVDFTRDIQPILKASCIKCHSLDPKKPKKKGAGEFRLDDKALAFKGGRSGPAIIPGNSKDSLLSKLLSGSVPRPVKGEDDKDIPPMPHAKKGEKFKPLSDKESALIRQWIDEGAQWPDPKP
jgi:hypothetical protein